MSLPGYSDVVKGEPKEKEDDKDDKEEKKAEADEGVRGEEEEKKQVSEGGEEKVTKSTILSAQKCKKERVCGENVAQLSWSRPGFV